MRTSKAPYVQHRWVELIELQRETTLLALDRAPDYGFTGVVLWSSFMDGLDDYYYTLPLVYRAHPEFNAERDQARIGRAATFLREFSRRARQKGLTLMHTYHVGNLQTGPGLPFGSRAAAARDALRRLHPDWLTPTGEPDMSRDSFCDFMAAEVDQFFTDFPDVDGLFCFNCECSLFTPSRLYDQKVSLQDMVDRSVEAVWKACRKHGKVMTHDIHSGGAHEPMSRAVIKAVSRFPDIILGADCTYSDWQFFLDTSPFLAEMARTNPIYVSFDAAGEFFGKGEMLGGWPQWIIRHFNNAKKHGLTVVSCRSAVNRPETSAFANPLTEMNLRVVARLGRDGRVNLRRELERWWGDHFAGAWDPRLADIVLSMEAAIGKVLHLNGVGMTNLAGAHPSIWVDQAKNRVWFWEQWDEPGTPINLPMVPQCGSRTRPVEELKQEKREGIETCRQSLAALESMDLPPETKRYFADRFNQAIDVASAFLDVIDAAHALHQIVVRHYDKSVADPAAVLSRARRNIYAHAARVEARWGRDFFTGFAGAMTKLADSIPAAEK